jgi:hypothetical protein
MLDVRWSIPSVQALARPANVKSHFLLLGLTEQACIGEHPFHVLMSQWYIRDVSSIQICQRMLAPTPKLNADDSEKAYPLWTNYYADAKQLSPIAHILLDTIRPQQAITPSCYQL